MVIVAKGIHGTVLFGKESTWGTSVSATKSVGLVQSIGTDLDGKVTETNAMGQAKAVSVDAGNVTPSGSLEVLMNNGRLLEYAVYGGVTTHADTSSDSTHTMVYANDLPSFSIEESYDETPTPLVKIWKGAFFKSTTISLALDDYLKCKTDFVAKDIDISGSSVTSPSVGTVAPLKGFQCTLELAGSPISYVQNWEVTFNRNSAIGHSLGSRVPSFGGSNTLSIDWKATVGFNSFTEAQRLLGQTSGILSTSPASFAATFKGNNGVTLGSGRQEISIGLTGCRTGGFKKTADLGDFIMFDISGKGLLGTTTFVDQVLNASW